MAEPSQRFEWATDAAYDAPGEAWDTHDPKLEPPDALKEEGWEPRARVNARFLNWILNRIGQWIDWLDDERDRFNAYCRPEGIELPAPVQYARRLGCTSAFIPVTDSWSHTVEERLRSEADGAVLRWDLSPILPIDGSIVRLRVLVKPGTARSSPNGILIRLYRQHFGVLFGSPSTAIHTVGSAEDDGTDDLQWITLSFVPGPGEPISAGAAWMLELVAGSDAGTNKDLVYAARVEFSSQTIRG